KPGLRLLLVRAGELEAIRAVNRRGIHVKTLQGLENRLPGPPKEGDSLVLLRILRSVLEKKDVGEGVPRAQHRRPLRARRLRNLTSEIVDLGDRLLQI